MNPSKIVLDNIIPENSALTVDSCNTVSHALDLMDRYRCHAVGVTVNGFFAGLFTRSDFIKRVVRQDLDAGKVAVGSVMTMNPIVIAAGSDIKEAYYLMCCDNYSHLPVIDGDKLLGIISEHDLRKDVAYDLKNTQKKNEIMESMFREPYGLCASY